MAGAIRASQEGIVFAYVEYFALKLIAQSITGGCCIHMFSSNELDTLLGRTEGVPPGRPVPWSCATRPAGPPCRC